MAKKEGSEPLTIRDKLEFATGIAGTVAVLAGFAFFHSVENRLRAEAPQIHAINEGKAKIIEGVTGLVFTYRAEVALNTIQQITGLPPKSD